MPENFPAFMIRPACPGHSSCVGVWLGYDGSASSGALYCQEGGHAWIGIPRELPHSVLANLPGRPATDLVGHDALEGWVIAEDLDVNSGGDAPSAFAIEWRP